MEVNWLREYQNEQKCIWSHGSGFESDKHKVNISEREMLWDEIQSNDFLFSMQATQKISQ